MSYIKQNFQNGDILHAEQLELIEDGIIDNQDELTQQKEDLAKLDRTTLYIDPEGYICLKESE